MSVKVSSWVWHGDECKTLMGNELVLMLSLADVADDNGRCRYIADDDDLTYDGLAKKVRVDRRTIERLIPKLRKQGLLTMQRGSKSRPNEFAIVVPWVQRSPDNLSGNDSGIPRQRVDIPRHDVQDSPTNDASVPLYRRIDVGDVATSDVASDALPSKYTPSVSRLCDLLAEKVRANGHKVGTVGEKWWAACDRLMRLDGYTAEQIEWMIHWSTSNEFWAANIRSMPTLREKFSTLVMQAKRDAMKHQAQSPNARANSVVEMGRRLHEAGVA